MLVLIADFDSLRVQALADACRTQGHKVVVTPHGAAALEAALEAPPDVVVCPVDLSVIDGTRLEAILRGNPRTRHAAFVFLVKDDFDAPMSMDPRDTTIIAPWHASDLIALLDASQRRVQRFGGSRASTEIEGSLAQISVVDLLEIFQMNRKSGAVKLWSTDPGQSGSIFVRNGQVVDATIALPAGSLIAGEKALYRMLTWNDGRFEFQPGDIAEPGRIQKPTRGLLLEGMRQVDEWSRTRAALPSEDARVVLAVPRERISNDTHPLTRQVIDAVEAYRRVREIVDHCTFPDYQVLRVLAGLLTKGLLCFERRTASAEQRASGVYSSVFTPHQLRRLRERIASQRPRAGRVVKVVVAAPDVDGVSALHAAFRESREFMTDPRMIRTPEHMIGVATLGHFSLGEGSLLRLIAVPTRPAYTPLWTVVAHRMLGALVLAPRATDAAAAAELHDVCTHLLAARPRGVVWVNVATASLEQSKAVAPALGMPSFTLPAGEAAGKLAALSQIFGQLVG
jgi:CheY-like chemotaxis protein